MRLSILGLSLMVGLTACFGGKDTCDTASGECGDDTASGDADTDSDADSDATFDDYAFGLQLSAGWDGSEMVEYSGTYSDGTEYTRAPWAQITMYEEAYFDAGDDRYTCITWVDVLEGDPIDFGENAGFGSEVTFQMQYADTGEEQTTCVMDEAVWGSSSPKDVLEAVTLGVGIGGVADFKAVLTEVGYDYDEFTGQYADELHTFYMAVDEGEGLSGGAYGYSWLFELDDSYAIKVDSSDEYIPLLNTDDYESGELPPQVFISSNSFFLPNTDGILY